jgi:magnesium transporter
LAGLALVNVKDSVAETFDTTLTEIAARLAVGNVPIFDGTSTAAEARAQLHQRAYDAVDAVLILDESGRYAGAAHLNDVLAAADTTRLSSLVFKDWPVVGPEVDQEHAATIAREHRVSAVPVVTEDGRPLGLIPALALLDTLAQEHHEDVNRLAGILKMGARDRHALDDPPLIRAGRRLPWLLVGLALSTGATLLMVRFEHALQANIVIAFFIPALVYLADAVGTQTEAVVVRGLSLEMRPLGPMLLAEFATGLLIGLPLALLAFLGIWLAFQDVALAGGVAVALFAASSIASVLGLLLPWLLARCGFDPAFGSGPVATIIQDVLTIAVYFVIMTMVISL